MTSLTLLGLDSTGLASIPSATFARMSALSILYMACRLKCKLARTELWSNRNLGGNRFSVLPSGLFAALSSLSTLSATFASGPPPVALLSQPSGR